MAISYIGGGTGTNTATVPAHVAGDVLFAFAFRDGNATAPTLPAGWVNIATRAGTTCSGRLAYQVATAPGTVSGTWTNATSLIIQVYRGCDSVDPIGATASNAGTTANTVNFAALTLENTSGSSWVGAYVGHRSTAPNLAIPPTGFTNRTLVTDATDEAAGHDSNGGLTSFAGETVNVGGGSTQGWVTFSYEMLAAAAGAVTGDASGASDTVGTATGSVNISANASGASDTTGTSTASVAISGAGAGDSETVGTSSGTVRDPAITGNAAGAADTVGTASAAVNIAAAGAGNADTVGTSAGSVAIAAAGAGTAETVGASTGTIVDPAITGDASGAADTVGTATGSVAIAAAGAGTSDTTGASTASVAISGAGAGDAFTTGSATGSDVAPVARVLRMRVDGRIEAFEAVAMGGEMALLESGRFATVT